jgi:4'-phosphopantetheinyl transferase
MLLSKKQVKLLWVGTAGIAAPTIDRLAKLLDVDERARAERFQRVVDRRDYVVAHALLRCGLAAATGRPAQSWAFRAGRHGKPKPVTRSDEPRIGVSLSHTRDAAAVALMLEHEVGVDVERLGRPDPEHAARAALAPGEKAYLRGLAPAARPDAFCAIWTLKEAYLKAIGTGLSRSLDSFEVTLAPIGVHDAMQSRPTDLFLRSMRLGDAHVGAVAVTHAPPERVALSVDAVDACWLLGPLGPQAE